MISWEPPLVTGAGDDSAVLESNTSPEKEMLKLYKPTDGTVSSQARIRTAHSNKHTPHMEHSIKYEVVRGRCRLPHMLLLLQDPLCPLFFSFILARFSSSYSPHSRLCPRQSHFTLSHPPLHPLARTDPLPSIQCSLPLPSLQTRKASPVGHLPPPLAQRERERSKERISLRNGLTVYEEKKEWRYKQM